MYYSVMALFFATGSKGENHSAAIMILEEIFGIDNSMIKSAKAERVTGSIMSHRHRSGMRRSRLSAMLLDAIARLTNEQKKSFREKLNARF